MSETYSNTVADDNQTKKLTFFFPSPQLNSDYTNDDASHLSPNLCSKVKSNNGKKKYLHLYLLQSGGDIVRSCKSRFRMLDRSASPTYVTGIVGGP